jgi:hypothetical protein
LRPIKDEKKETDMEWWMIAIIVLGAGIGGFAFIALAGAAGLSAGGFGVTAMYFLGGAVVGAAVGGLAVVGFTGGGGPSGTTNPSSNARTGNQYVLELKYMATNQLLHIELKQQEISRFSDSYQTESDDGWLGELLDDVETNLDYGSEGFANMSFVSGPNVPELLKKYVRDGLMVNSTIYIQAQEE